ESFGKAVEQLGSEKLETRLGGIYTLERLSQESERDYWPIMETLTAFIREHARWESGQKPAPFLPLDGTVPDATEVVPSKEYLRLNTNPATDVEAILTVLGRRQEKAIKLDNASRRRLMLQSTDLRAASLSETHLEQAFFTAAHLDGANLLEAHLDGAHFIGAH